MMSSSAWSSGSVSEKGEPVAEGTAWRTAISQLYEDNPFLYGYDLEQLAKSGVPFSAVILLAGAGALPLRGAAKMANALLVLIAAHGIGPSGAVARVMAACGVPIQVSVAASAMAIGDYHGGSGEQLAWSFQEAMAAGKVGQRSSTAEFGTIAEDVVRSFFSRVERVPGCGHPMHAGGVPRAPFVISLARELCVASDYCILAKEVERVLASASDRRIPMNITGATAVAFSDLGLLWKLMLVFNKSVVRWRDCRLWRSRSMSADGGWSRREMT